MNIIDLSQKINSIMTVYPNTCRPVIKTTSSINEGAVCNASEITIQLHAGTHVDAPYHLSNTAKTIDMINVSRFVGNAFVADFTNHTTPRIELNDIKIYEKELAGAQFMIINTGWHVHWNTEQYFNNFPVLSTAAADWLTQFNLKGIGVDTISVDPVDSSDLIIHKILLQKEILIVENLCNINKLQNKKFLFVALPLYIEKADGCPIRAIAITQ